MDVQNAIARWESEGGAIPQVQTSRTHFKALTLRRILVPIDFSPESLKTLRYAKRLGDRFGAKLHLVHVVTPLPAFLPQRTPLPANLLEELAATPRDRLQELAADCSLPMRPRPYSVAIGGIADEISKVAHTMRAELIAIATRGYTGLKRALVGSTTESVVRNAPCPVLVVRESERASSSRRVRKSPLQVRKILVPLDFSEASRLGLEYALAFAQEFHSTVVLFHAVVVSGLVVSNRYTALQLPALIESQQDYAKGEMEELRQAISRKGGEVTTKITVGSPVEQIAKFVAKAGVDLIITSTHGRTGLSRAFIGSTAERVVRYATCPVLVVPNRFSHQERA